MEFTIIKKNHWNEFREIYLEAFPKRERKPYFALRHSSKRGKVKVMAATEGGQFLGFSVLVPYENMVMVDYLAVSSKIRSKGTGSFMLEQICKQFSNKTIVLLIERLDDAAQNQEQRIARKRFYLKNGFTSANIFTKGVGGDMEILNYSGIVSREDYLRLQKYALGNLMFHLSGIQLV